METYKLLAQKTFESNKKFEKRLNEMCNTGWKAISITADHGSNTILLEKTEKYQTY